MIALMCIANIEPAGGQAVASPRKRIPRATTTEKPALPTGRRSKLLVNLSMSLDGYVAGPNDGPDNPLGDGGGKLFEWWTAGSQRVGPDDRFKPPARSVPVVREMFEGGAVIVGRRTFDIAQGWGGHHPGGPFFVLTHRTPERWVGPGTGGVAVKDGIESALEKAREVAKGRDIAIGSADVAKQYLRAGLLDEVFVNLVPTILGGGVRLFPTLDRMRIDLKCIQVVESDGVTHLRYRVVK